jgi:hypothetical protein
VGGKKEIPVETNWILEEGEMKVLWVSSRRGIFMLVLAMAWLAPAATAQILKTDYSNPDFTVSDKAWSSNICGGQTFLENRTPYFEWEPVFGSEFDTKLVGLSGTIPADPTYSGKDLPFTHPFGTDWEFFIVPDTSYASLLAPSNGCTSFTAAGDCVNNISYGNTANAVCTAAGTPNDCCTGAGAGSCNVDQEYREGVVNAHKGQLTLPTSPLGVQGILGFETDQGLVPPDYRMRVKKGDRVVMFGRWITDCGHPDFHTEMHPPLLTAFGRVTGSKEQPVTSTEVISRPYLVGQTFEDGKGIRHHLYNEMLKGVAVPDCFPIDDAVSALLDENGGCKVTVTECVPFTDICADVDTYCLAPPLWFTTPCTTRFEAHPNFEPKPFNGVQTMSYIVNPPVPRQCAKRKPLVSSHFTVRHGVSASLEPYNTDAARVTITMDDSQYTAPPLPPKADLSLSLDDLSFLNSGVGDEISKIRTALLIISPLDLGPLFTLILDRGLLTDCYDPSYGTLGSSSFPDCAALKPLAASSPADSQNVVVTTPIDQLSGVPISAEDNSNSQVFPVYGSTSLEWSQEKYPPTITIVAPTTAQYLHSDTITLNYSAADTGCGVGSEMATMDGAATLPDGHSLASGQTIKLLTELTVGDHTFAVTAADNVGGTNSASVTFTIIVTAASIQTDVTQFLQSGDIKGPGEANSLLSKLVAAAAKRAAGKCSTAANIYQAFIQELQAQSGKGVSVTAAAIMIADAQYLITHCS